MLETTSLTKPKVQGLLQQAFRDMERSAGVGFIPTGPLPDLEILEQREISKERIAALSEEIADLTFSPEIKVKAMLVASHAGIRFQDQPQAIQFDLMQGVARIEQEQARLMLFRLDDRVTPFQPSDPLFAHIALASLPSGDSLTKAQPMGMSFAGLVGVYLAYGEKHWVSKTVASRKRQLGLLGEFLGWETLVRTIDVHRMRDYRDALLKLSKHYSRVKAKSFDAKVTANPSKRIAAKTALLIFETPKAFFRWALEEGHVETDPTATLKIKLPQSKQALATNRRPFTKEELRSLFSSPVYSGCKSVSNRFEAGPHRLTDGKFWIPLIGHYTGLRLGEIVQLHLSDVIMEGSIPYLFVREDGGATPGSADAKHVKSKAGVRKVPIHPDLIDLGFKRFFEKVRQKRKGKGRLFYDIGYGSDGMPSGRFSKWFARFRKSVGITDPEAVFHSFRHGAKDALRETQAPGYIIDQIMGHAEQATASYGQGAGLETLYETVKKMKFQVDLKTIVQPMP